MSWLETRPISDTEIPIWLPQVTIILVTGTCYHLKCCSKRLLRIRQPFGNEQLSEAALSLRVIWCP